MPNLFFAGVYLRVGDTGHLNELKYQHFSVVVNASRRMPFVTNVRIQAIPGRRSASMV